MDNNDKVTERLADTMQRIETEMRGLRKWIVGSGIGVAAVVVALTAYQATWFQHSLADDRAANREFLEQMDKRWQAINDDARKRHALTIESLNKSIDRMDKALEKLSGRTDKMVERLSTAMEVLWVV